MGIIMLLNGRIFDKSSWKNAIYWLVNVVIEVDVLKQQAEEDPSKVEERSKDLKY